MFRNHAASFNSTLFPARVANVIRMSKLNFSNLPSIRLDTRDWEKPRSINTLLQDSVTLNFSLFHTEIDQVTELTEQAPQQRLSLNTLRSSDVIENSGKSSNA